MDATPASPPCRLHSVLVEPWLGHASMNSLFTLYSVVVLVMVLCRFVGAAGGLLLLDMVVWCGGAEDATGAQGVLE